MNEENSVMNGEKPRKKRRSLWWLWFLLILAAFAGGIVVGLKINTLPLPTEVRDRLYPVLESYIPGSTTPQTPEPAAVPAPPAGPEPSREPEQTAAPAETPAPEETAAPLEETVMTVETPAPLETEEPEPLRVSETAAFESDAEPAKKYIGIDAALEIALRHAGVEEADAAISGVYRTKDADGEAIYEVSFQGGDIGYEYQIGAVDGEIAGWKMSGFTFSDTAAFAADFAGNDVPEAEVSAAPAPEKELIGEENAREIAFNHAAVKPAEVLRATVELKQDESAEFYSVEFKTATRRFSYEIEACTGEILHNEVNK